MMRNELLMDIHSHIRDANAADLQSLTDVQKDLASVVVSEDQSVDFKRVAGIDVAYKDDEYCAAVCTVDINNHCLESTKTTFGSESFPYLSGFFAYRELPAVLDVFESITEWPDLILFDGNGQLHARRCGAACYLGLALDIPVIGVSKNPPSRDLKISLELKRGNSCLIDDPNIGLGMALCTKDDVKPLFVSVGHKVSLNTAKEVVLDLCQFRVPEPVRMADHACRSGLKNHLLIKGNS
jgi:deoxyribonuclease V